MLRKSKYIAINLICVKPFLFRMKESKVLMVNLTPTCTELARHLVLSGINIKLVD